MLLLNMVKSCYCKQEIAKKEINLNDLENNNLLENNNKYLQIQNKSIKELKSTTNSSIMNAKNIVEQNNDDKFSDNDISPISNNKKITPSNEVKTVKTHQLKINHAHFPTINSKKVESEYEKEKKIKNIRNSLMKDLF